MGSQHGLHNTRWVLIEIGSRGRGVDHCNIYRINPEKRRQRPLLADPKKRTQQLRNVGAAAIKMLRRHRRADSLWLGGPPSGDRTVGGERTRNGLSHRRRSRLSLAGYSNCGVSVNAVDGACSRIDLGQGVRSSGARGFRLTCGQRDVRGSAAFSLEEGVR